MYVWKILEGRVPNVGIEANHHPRRGRLCHIRGSEGSVQGIRTLIHHSFTHNGPRLFNCLPSDLRNLSNISIDSFKRRLDRWLGGLPDHPPIPGYPSSYHNTLPEVCQLRKGVEKERLPGTSGGPPQLCH